MICLGRQLKPDDTSFFNKIFGNPRLQTMWNSNSTNKTIMAIKYLYNVAGRQVQKFICELVCCRIQNSSVTKWRSHGRSCSFRTDHNQKLPVPNQLFRIYRFAYPDQQLLYFVFVYFLRWFLFQGTNLLHLEIISGPIIYYVQLLTLGYGIFLEAFRKCLAIYRFQEYI